MVTRLTPEILRLQSSSRSPITVYIDSPGGHVASMETILRMLKLSDQDSSAPCRILTAVTTRAASAAADLLSSGDYAVAYPTSAILYHGLRQQETNPLTAESTSMLANLLRLSNDIYAQELARKIDDRFTFRFVMAKSDFDEIRIAKNSPQMSDLDCFIHLVESKLSDQGKTLWGKVKDRHGRYDQLFSMALAKLKGPIGPKTVAQIEATIIKAIVDFELKSNKNNPSWSFRHSGIGRLADDFYLLNEYLSSYGNERLNKWCTSFGRFMLPQAELDAIEAIADENQKQEKLIEKTQPIIRPLQSFFVALCHALQEGENELTATDAYWLGLVDEVVGENLLSLRTFSEFQPEPVKAEADNEEANVPVAVGTEIEVPENGQELNGDDQPLAPEKV